MLYYVFVTVYLPASSDFILLGFGTRINPRPLGPGDTIICLCQETLLLAFHDIGLGRAIALPVSCRIPEVTEPSILGDAGAVGLTIAIGIAICVDGCHVQGQAKNDDSC